MKHMLDYYEVKDASQDEVEKVIQMLPKVNKAPSLATKLKLQVFITPKYYYVLFVLLTMVIINQLNSYIISSYLYDETNSFYTAIIIYLIAIITLTIPEINRSHMYKMEEIERSCRYHYIQLLFQRVTMFSFIILMLAVVLSIWSAKSYSISLLTSCGIVFTPILMITQITLIIYKLAHIISTISRIIAFVTVSVLCMILFVPFIMSNQTIVNLSLIMIFIITLQYYIRKLLKEAKTNETFSVESE